MSESKIVKRVATVALALFLGALALMALAGCEENSLTGGGGFKDLKGIAPQDPDRTALVNNVDGFPNLVAVCVNGAGFVTTTREAAGALTAVPEWNASAGGWCAK